MTKVRGRRTSLELRKLQTRDQDLERPRLSGCPSDESTPLQCKHHLVHRWRAHPEVPRHVRLRRRHAVELGVRGQEGQVLSLSFRELRLHIPHPSSCSDRSSRAQEIGRLLVTLILREGERRSAVLAAGIEL